MRVAFYGAYHPDYLSPGYVFGVSLFLCVAGLLFLRRYHRDLIAG